ncbi:MAG: 50S ribosomal protein L15 [Myxococcota bacterium]|nr:50S ribosomal protein L15 [Myxococcota bacterium]
MLDRLSPRPGARHRPKRVGRGPGSGWNKTSGRGEKGQGHRSAGRETPLWFEGGQMPLARRTPKRGFKNIHRKAVESLNVRELANFAEGSTVDPEALLAAGLIRGRAGCVKLLGDGDAPKGLTIKVHKASAAAIEKIQAAGGTVEILA